MYKEAQSRLFETGTLAVSVSIAGILAFAADNAVSGNRQESRLP